MQNPIIPPFQYLERYRNKGTRIYSAHSEYTDAEERYRPDSKNEKFRLMGYELPIDQLMIYSANPSEDLRKQYLKDDKGLFCIHPQVIKMSPDDSYVSRIISNSLGEKQISVVPSSSTRTLYVENGHFPHALKVHFPYRISRYTRKMRDEVIEQAINISLELEKGIHRMDSTFAFLREVIGIVHKDLEPESERCENWGYLIRDMTPFPNIQVQQSRAVNEKHTSLIPGFALYGDDYFEAETPLLLFTLIGKREPVQFVLENIMLPIIRQWVDCFLHFGYLLEPHGQNVLFEVDDTLAVRRIVHRDLSVGIDMRRRRDLGLSSENLNSYNRMEGGEFHSITYDRFMGGHFFDRIVEACMVHYPNLSKDEFTEPCKKAFARLFPEHTTYFPETVWYFSEKRDAFNKPLYENTGRKPEWRP